MCGIDSLSSDRNTYIEVSNLPMPVGRCQMQAIKERKQKLKGLMGGTKPSDGKIPGISLCMLIYLYT